tara:strand:+ start:126 stop:920 length:795 start_codon:yes stop_codon:yes gene_type:complete
MEVLLITVATFIAGVGSVLVAGFLSVNLLAKFEDYFLSFAAGALLSTAFLNLLPESFHLVDHHSELMLTLLLGIIFFFFLNKLHLYHHSHDNDKKIDISEATRPNMADNKINERKFAGRLVIIILGDSIHKFGDGVLIAAAFIADTRVGVLATLAVLSHEVPHHIADITIIKEETNSFSKAIRSVSCAGLFSVVGGVSSFYLLDSFYGFLPFLLVIASSSFIYVALADLIPQLKKVVPISKTMKQFFWLFVGVALIGLSSLLAH